MPYDGPAPEGRRRRYPRHPSGVGMMVLCRPIARVETRGYSPMPLRGSRLPTDSPAPEGRGHVAAGFNPRNSDALRRAGPEWDDVAVIHVTPPGLA